MRNPFVLLGLGVAGVLAYYYWLRKTDMNVKVDQIKKNYFQDLAENQRIGQVAQNMNNIGVPPLLQSDALRPGYLSLITMISPIIGKDGMNTNTSPNGVKFDTAFDNESVIKNYGSLDYNSPLLQNVVF